MENHPESSEDRLPADLLEAFAAEDLTEPHACQADKGDSSEGVKRSHE